MPQIVKEAMDEICRETARQGSRLWLDAEQQILQHGVDDWTIELMRKYNTNREALVYNTIQAYLKSARANVERHLQLAAKEGWTLGIKLVRGAYIDHETRSLIHDTKDETDKSYDGIARSLINQEGGSIPMHSEFPRVQLFLATHNAASVDNAYAHYRRRIESRQPTVSLECGQIQGMADELSFALVQRGEEMAKTNSKVIPKAFKCLTWGTLTECLGYLHRRAIENRGAVERTQDMAKGLRKELLRRLFKGTGV